MNTIDNIRLKEKEINMENSNRIIKFRAWHKFGYMVQSKTIDDLLNGKMIKVCKPIKRNMTKLTEGKTTSSLMNCVNYIHTNIFTHKDFKLMQFTGLKDRHEKEIYEGDILKITWGGKNIGIFLVDWTTFLGVEPMKIHDKISKRIFKTKGDNLEIIGNIYENPELLKSD